MIHVPMGEQLIKLIIAAFNAGQPVMLIGTHGLGKSQIIETVAGRLNVGCEIFDLSIMEPVDLAGIPRPTAEGCLEYAIPKRLPRDMASKGILFFEELNRVSKDLRAACLQICTARRLNDYKLPAGWIPMAAINPSQER